MDTTTSILLAGIVILLTFNFYKWLFRSRDYWKIRGIPSASGILPFVGNTLPILGMQKNFSTLCLSIYEAHRGQSMVGFYNLAKPTLMVREPDLVKTVLQSSFSSFIDNEVGMDLDLDPLFGRDPLYVRGQVWRDTRATFNTALSTKRIKHMSQAVVNVCQKLENHLAEKMKGNDCLELESKFLFSRYTTEVAAATVFSIDGNSFADDYKGTLLYCMKLTMDLTMLKALQVNLLYFLPALSRLIKARYVPLEVDKFFRRVVKDVEDLRLKEVIPRDDVLQLMLDLEKSGKISRIQAIAHAFSFFLESFETGSLALGFMTYFIAKHHDVQNRVRAEVETVLENHGGQLNYEAIKDMTYLEQVMNETLRFFPPTGALSRVCTKNIRLQGSDGLTVDVKQGTTVVVPILGLHRDPDIWKNPDTFDPERFGKDNIDDTQKFVHLPFSSGPRVCPGRHLGTIQVKAAIATIVKNYRIELSPRTEQPVVIDPRFYLLTARGGIWIRLRSLEQNVDSAKRF